MIDMYFTQSATWKRRTGSDAYGQPTFDIQTIKCRWETGNKLVVDSQGKTIVSTGMLMTTSPIAVGDFINDGTRDWPVIQSSGQPDLIGNTSHYEVMV